MPSPLKSVFLAAVLTSFVGCVGVADDGSSPVTAVINGMSFSDLCVQVEVDEDGEAIFEGDIVVGRIDTIARDCKIGETVEPDSDRSSASLAHPDERLRWPKGTIPFVIDSSFSDEMKQRIYDGIQHWHAKTNIRFTMRNNDASYVLFQATDEKKCNAHLGRIGKMQKVTLGPTCSKLNVIHELGHAVGFWHEHSRSDRDKYVKINWDNIEEDKKQHFEKRIKDGTDIGSYDYESQMHYRSNAFSIDGEPTIVSRDPNITTFRNPDGLSQGDIQGVKAIYPNIAARSPDCSACAVGGCVATCRLAGFSDGQCDNPGSIDPRQCCTCSNDETPPEPKPIGGKCSLGYERVADSCVDINECADDPCSQTESCINTDGSYKCDSPMNRPNDCTAWDAAADGLCAPGTYNCDCSGGCASTTPCDDGGDGSEINRSDCTTWDEKANAACAPGTYNCDCSGGCASTNPC